jgi:aminoglycoside/choline kinase family phosphotransferase
VETNQSSFELTPELEEEIMEISTRNLVDFYSEDLRNINVRRLTETIPPGVLRQLRLLGIINSRRTYRNGKVLYLTEKGESILREITS